MACRMRYNRGCWHPNEPPNATVFYSKSLGARWQDSMSLRLWQDNFRSNPKFYRTSTAVGIKLWLAPHNSLHWPRYIPGAVGWMYCLLIRPGTASALQASAGRANLWSTSVLVMFKEFRDIGSVGADDDASRRGEFVDMNLSHASLVPTL